MATRLLPGSNAVQYANWITQHQTSEGYTNGVWVSILSYHFRAEIAALQYSINPEVNVGSGFQDILVTRNNFAGANPIPVWQIIVEGKSQATGNTFQKTLDQLKKYADKISGMYGWCYLIAAIGSECMFWRYEKQSGNRIQPMGIDATGAVAIITTAPQTPNLPLSQSYSIINDQQFIFDMLTWITNHPQ